MNDDYLPLAYLNAWEYYPRRFFREYQLGEMADNEHILLGRHLHRNVDQEGEEQLGDTLIRRRQWVWSDRLQVKGIINAVEETYGQLVPLEYKIYVLYAGSVKRTIIYGSEKPRKEETLVI